MAKLGKERLEEIENPELGVQPAKSLYEQKGYSKEWIDKRLRGISVRKSLTDEWKNRGAAEGVDFAVLSNEIMKGAFGMRVDEYKNYKGLVRQELRDHMTELELIITMLGEAATTEFTTDRDSQGMPNLKQDARDGGDIAGTTRRNIEKRTSRKIISKDNFLRQNKKIAEEAV